MFEFEEILVVTAATVVAAGADGGGTPACLSTPFRILLRI